MQLLQLPFNACLLRMENSLLEARKAALAMDWGGSRRRATRGRNIYASLQLEADCVAGVRGDK